MADPIFDIEILPLLNFLGIDNIIYFGIFSYTLLVFVKLIKIFFSDREIIYLENSLDWKTIGLF